MAEKTLGQIFTAGFNRENPVLVLLLGLCPALAVTTNGWGGLGMGIATTFVLLGSSVTVSLIAGLVPRTVRIPAYILVIATFVTAVDLLLNAYVYDLHKALGIFIPLIVVNCTVLGRAEAFASRQPVHKAAIDALGMGIGFTIALTLLGLSREFLASGAMTFVEAGSVAIRFSPFAEDGIDGAVMMLLPPGAFIMLGIIVALSNKMNQILDARAVKTEEASSIPAQASESSGAARVGAVVATGEGYASVLLNRKSACGEAQGNLHCAACRDKQVIVVVEDGYGVKKGDEVEVGLEDESRVLALAAAGYLTPAAAILIGALTAGVWGVIAGLSGALLAIAATAPYLKRKGLWARVKGVKRNGEYLAVPPKTPSGGLKEENAPEKVKAAAN